MGGWPARPGGIEDAMKLVSDEVTDSLTISGNVTKVKDRTCKSMPSGISYSVILPLVGKLREIVEALAPGRW